MEITKTTTQGDQRNREYAPRDAGAGLRVCEDMQTRRQETRLGPGGDASMVPLLSGQRGEADETGSSGGIYVMGSMPGPPHLQGKG